LVGWLVGWRVVGWRIDTIPRPFFVKRAVPKELRMHPLAKFVWTKLIRLGQIWLDVGKIEAKIRQK